MNKKEYLLQCLAEEAAEISQAVSKVLRFGPDNQWPGYEGTAIERLMHEIADFTAVIEMLAPLFADRGLKGDPTGLIEAKKAKVLSMMEYSRQLGTLEYDQ